MTKEELRIARLRGLIESGAIMLKARQELGVVDFRFSMLTRISTRINEELQPLTMWLQGVDTLTITEKTGY